MPNSLCDEHFVLTRILYTHILVQILCPLTIKDLHHQKKIKIKIKIFRGRRSTIITSLPRTNCLRISHITIDRLRDGKKKDAFAHACIALNVILYDIIPTL